MLKKAGIIVATSAAALLALSPLAFAHPSAGCEFGSQGAENTIAQSAESGDAMSLTGDVVGDGGANTGAIANTQSQAPDDSCNSSFTETNTDVEDNDSTTDIDGSFNEASTEESTTILDLLGLDA